MRNPVPCLRQKKLPHNVCFNTGCNLHLLKCCLIVTWNISTPRRQNLLMLKFESWVLGQNCDAVAYFSLWYFIVVFVSIFTWYWRSLRIEMMRRCVDNILWLNVMMIRSYLIRILIEDDFSLWGITWGLLSLGLCLLYLGRN